MLRLGDAWHRLSSLVGTWGRLTLLGWGAALSDASTLLVLSSHTQLLCLALQTHGEPAAAVPWASPSGSNASNFRELGGSVLRNWEKIMVKAFPEASSMERPSWVVAPGFRVWWGVGPGPETIDK